MKLALAFIFLTLVKADPAQACAQRLLEVALTADATMANGYEFYSDLVRQVSWPNFYGRPFCVQFDFCGQRFRVNQSVMSAADFAQAHPFWSSSVRRLVDLHKTIKAEVLRAPMVTAWQDDRIEFANLVRQMPGEIAQVTVRLGGRMLQSREFAHFIDHPDQPPDLTSVRIDWPSIVNQLPAFVRQVILETPRAQHDDLELEIFIAHTHPGLPAPLSLADELVLNQTTLAFADQLPFLSVRVAMVAIAENHEIGDLIFLSERRRAARTPLDATLNEELLK